MAKQTFYELSIDFGDDRVGYVGKFTSESAAEDAAKAHTEGEPMIAKLTCETDDDGNPIDDPLDTAGEPVHATGAMHRGSATRQKARKLR